MSKKRKISPEQVAAIKMRQKEIINEFNRRQVSSGRGKSNFIITTQRFQNQKNTAQLSSKDLKALKREEEFEAESFGKLDITRRGRT